MKMNDFTRQLYERLRQDDKDMSEALMDVADSLSGRQRFHDQAASVEEVRREIETICRYYHAPFPENIPETEDVNELIDYIVRPSGIMRRRILLQEKWWKNGDGAVLAVRKDNGRITALIPGHMGGYQLCSPDTGKYEKLSKQHKDLFEEEALCFYRPLPSKPLSGKELIKFLFRGISISDIIIVILASLLATGVGMLTPLITKIVFSQLIPTGKISLIGSMAILLVSAAIGGYLITAVKTRILDRIRLRMDVTLQNAVTGRLLHLPAAFFQGKSAGETAQAVFALNLLPDILTNSLMGSVLSAVFAFMYIAQIGSLAPSLFLPSLITLLAQLAIILLSLKQKVRKAREELSADKQTQGIVYSLITGIQRVRLSGSEKRVFARWARQYKYKAGAKFRLPFPAVIQNELVAFTALLGTLWVYAAGAYSGLEVSAFAAFLSAFAMATGSFTQLSQSSQQLSYLKPSLQMAEPILNAVPETGSDKKAVGSLKGGIELAHVSFRYSTEGPYIIKDLNLKIRPGEYVAVTGRSGCGKSTLLRLLLGFETPETGSVIYDGIDLKEIDPVSLRHNIGTVLQDGRLFSGDIYSNITVSAPWLSEDDAWKAAEMAGAADDIRQMPMKMHTMISEGSGGISGGQKQRLMIARAVAPGPKVLIFDEATSALDNITQKIVSDSLNSLKCTRIVVAHRLSTIKQCDRIIAIDDGRIVEDGSYEELLAAEGFFADLVKRQQEE